MSFPEEATEVVTIRAKRRRLEDPPTSLARFNPGPLKLGKGQSMIRLENDKADARRGPNRSADSHKRWVLRDASGKGTHTGTPEASLTGNNTRLPYFVLVPDGDGFRAEHVSEWFTFRPDIKFNTFTLDDAEKQMNNPRLAFSANLNRLKKYADQADEGTAVHLKKATAADIASGDDAGDEAKAGPKAAPERNQKGWDQRGNERPDGNQGVEGDEEKPESWEHEEERADDDVEMGDDAASEPEPPPVKSDGEDERLAGILKGAGMDSPSQASQPGSPSSEDEEAADVKDEEADGDEEDEDDDDDGEDVDLDALHGAVKAKPSSRSQTPDMRQQPPDRAGSKRRAPTASPQPSELAKKVKTEAGSAVKQETFPPLTAAEVVACLQQWGQLGTAELTDKLSMRKRSEADKKAFTGLVKQVAMLQTRPDGKKVVVLRLGKG